MLHRQLEDHCHPVGGAGKGGEDYPAFRGADMAIEIRKYSPLWRGEAGQFGIGGVGEQAEHPLLAVMRHALNIEGFTIDGGVVKFEITGEYNNAYWGGNRQGEAVGN